MALHDPQAQRAPVIVALPAEIEPANQDRAFGRLYAAFTAGAAVVIADFTATTFCDFSSLRRLVAIQHRAAARGAQLRLAMPLGSPVRRMVQLTDLDHLLPDSPASGGRSWTPRSATEPRAYGGSPLTPPRDPCLAAR